MPDSGRSQDGRNEHHHHHPGRKPRRIWPRGGRRLARRGPVKQHLGQADQRARDQDPAQIPECPLQSDVERLFLGRGRGQVHAVAGNVLRRRGKARHPEEGNGERQVGRQPEGKGRARESDHHGDLHGEHEKTLAAKQLHQRRPQWFDHPRQVHGAGVGRDLGVGQPQVLVHDGRHHRHRDHGRAHGEVETGHPEQWVGALLLGARHGGLAGWAKPTGHSRRMPFPANHHHRPRSRTRQR